MSSSLSCSLPEGVLELRDDRDAVPAGQVRRAEDEALVRVERSAAADADGRDRSRRKPGVVDGSAAELDERRQDPVRTLLERRRHAPP